MKSWVTPILNSSCLKMLLLKVLKLQKPIFYPLVDVSICFNLLLGFALNACSEIDIYFVLFEFVVVLLWESMTFYWIKWRPHNGDPMGITLLKYYTTHFLLILFWIIFNLQIQTFSLLLINENDCSCFLYKNKSREDDYGVPFFQSSFAKGLSSLVQLLTLWFNSQKQLFFSKKINTVSYKIIYN